MWGADFVDIIFFVELEASNRGEKDRILDKWDIFNLLLEGSSWENNNKNGMDFLKN